MVPILITGCITQPEPEKVPVVIYHMEGSQEAYGITETHDGNHYIITGWTDKGGEYYPPRCMLLKVDKEGNLVERKVFLSLEWSCDAIIKAPDSNYLLRSNHYVVLMDDDLNIISRTYIPNSTPNFVVDVFEEVNDRVFMVTSTDLGLPRGYHIYAFEQGDIIDSSSFYFDSADNVVSAVVEGTPNDLYIAGKYASGDTSGYKLVKLNNDLDSVLVNFIDVGEIFGYSAGYVTGMERFGDGTLLISALIVRGFLDGFSALFKVDSMGNILKDTTIDYSMTAIEDMTKVEGGDIVLIGSALRDGYFFNFVMRLRPDLSVVWYKEFLEDFACSLAYASIIQDSDGNLAIAGYCAGLDDMAFMKLDSNTGEPIVWSER